MKKGNPLQSQTIPTLQNTKFRSDKKEKRHKKKYLKSIKQIPSTAFSSKGKNTEPAIHVIVKEPSSIEENLAPNSKKQIPILVDERKEKCRE